MTKRCAVYTRKSSEEGLEQDFNSLQAQREACEAFIKSQQSEGWRLVPEHYDDGGISGGTMERPALKKLLVDIEAGRVDVIVVYKGDRLTRSLADFAKMVELFDSRGVSFVAVTQQFNTTSSMGRLTLNVLLSFAQFEREVTGERIRDKIAASKRAEMGTEDKDARFIFLWISFNAAYAHEFGFEQTERDLLRGFLAKLLAVDASKAVHQLLFKRFTGVVRVLIEDKFVFEPFWRALREHDSSGEWERRFDRDKKAAFKAVMGSDTLTMLSVVFDPALRASEPAIHNFRKPHGSRP